jgi:hypothetical protein
MLRTDWRSSALEFPAVVAHPVIANNITIKVNASIRFITKFSLKSYGPKRYNTELMDKLSLLKKQLKKLHKLICTRGERRKASRLTENDGRELSNYFSGSLIGSTPSCVKRL